MVVTEALVVAYVTRRALEWYRDDVETDERGAPLEDVRELEDDDPGDKSGLL